ncbi:hypothetical protein GCM10009115_19170 [Sphingopyxis soli]|uniref:LysM domain-containing protein n=1 Tax=Sphingopyxis soli TaxID=592051 RepID=A0ABN1M5E1_9SPHN|nr:LysM domain-containing protein [Sphingopyxis soli]
MTGNNGTADLSYTASIADRAGVRPATSATTAGLFHNGTKTGAAAYADFGLSYDPYNSGYQGAAGGTYTVRTGDTLASIAQALWGDANLWYKLAAANGMSGNAALIEGQTLTLPTGVTRSSHSASTFKPYDPTDALGDLSPTTPKPPKKPKCGVFGQILVAAIAIGVALIATAGAASALSSEAFSTVLGAMTGGAAVTGVSAGAWIAGGVVGGAVGSMASQGFAVATGIQEKFSWKGVGLAAIAGGVGGAIGGGGLFGETGLFGSGTAATAARAAVGSAVTQGIGVATGLQSKFDFAGVAAAGIGAGVGLEVGKRIGGAGVGTFAASIAASAIANAATRSAIEGNSFGDNLLAAIPDTIAQIAMRGLGTAVDGVSSDSNGGSGGGGGIAEDRYAGGKMARLKADARAKPAFVGLLPANGLSQSASYAGSSFRISSVSDAMRFALGAVTGSGEGIRTGVPTIGDIIVTGRTLMSAQALVALNMELVQLYGRQEARLAPPYRARYGITNPAPLRQASVVSEPSRWDRFTDGVYQKIKGVALPSMIPTSVDDLAFQAKSPIGYSIVQHNKAKEWYGNLGSWFGPQMMALQVGRPPRLMLSSMAAGTRAAEGTPSIEAAYQARYASAYERGVVHVDARLASGDIVAPVGQPPHLFRANQIDDFARQDLKAFALQQGHGADMVRINQRLYIEGSSGKYRIPDLYFPQSGTILDGTLGFKNARRPQIVDFRAANGNAPIGIVRPEVYGGSYWIAK